jgi:hypothetical protein
LATWTRRLRPIQRPRTNHSSRPSETGRRQLQPNNDPAHRAFHAQYLRAAADLILAGAPFIWSSPGDGFKTGGLTYEFDEKRWREAIVNVWNRVRRAMRTT